jgi:hypothetical protein
MISLDAAVTRLPIVLVVDPVAASRQAMWRLLNRSFARDIKKAQALLRQADRLVSLRRNTEPRAHDQQHEH